MLAARLARRRAMGPLPRPARRRWLLPLVVLMQGVGDLRATYRLLAPSLGAAYYRVVLSDLRGHGDSDPTYPCRPRQERAR